MAKADAPMPLKMTLSRPKVVNPAASGPAAACSPRLQFDEAAAGGGPAFLDRKSRTRSSFDLRPWTFLSANALAKKRSVRSRTSRVSTNPFRENA